MMCLSCGCNGRHLKADGSCLCGCAKEVTAWPVEKVEPTVVKIPLEKLTPPDEDHS